MMIKNNKKIAQLLKEIAEFLEIKGVPYKPRAYRRAAFAIEDLNEDMGGIYKKRGLKGIEKIPGVGKSIAKKIEEYLLNGKIKYHQELNKTKGLSLEELKKSAKKREIIYSRYTKPAKQLLELAGSVEKAKKAIDVVAEWAKSRGLDYAIETVFKKWLELDRLRPKEIVKKPYYDGNPMVWSETKKKWYVITPEGEWLEFAGDDKDIEWRTEK